MCIKADSQENIAFAKKIGMELSTPGDVFNYTPGVCSEGIPLRLLVEVPFSELVFPALLQGVWFVVLAFVGYTFLMFSLGLTQLPVHRSYRGIGFVIGLIFNKLAYTVFYTEFGAVMWRILGDTIFGIWVTIGYYSTTAFLTDFFIWIA